MHVINPVWSNMHDRGACVDQVELGDGNVVPPGVPLLAPLLFHPTDSVVPLLHQFTIYLLGVHAASYHSM